MTVYRALTLLDVRARNERIYPGQVFAASEFGLSDADVSRLVDRGYVAPVSAPPVVAVEELADVADEFSGAATVADIIEHADDEEVRERARALLEAPQTPGFHRKRCGRCPDAIS